MKRKRGSKKSKSKKRPEASTNEPVEKVSSDNAEDSSGVADIDNDIDEGEGEGEGDSGKEVETTTVLEKDQPEKSADTNSNVADTNSNVVVNKPTGNLVYGRVKVRIKTSKVLDSPTTTTPTPTRSDTDVSSQQVGPERNETPNEKIEDSENSLPDTNTSVSENLPKKVGSIKIKSSKSLGSSVINPCTSALAQNEETCPKEAAGLRVPRSNHVELKVALEVIKKIMKMDAAEPFNVPVNPIALGIPDYLDVIDTPMDFGTICSNLESGDKYKNAEDVYKDVEYVWNNCYKYNKKGDYVVELMKRVKKNFTKYWMSAGLYIEQTQGSSGADVTQPNDGPHDGTVKAQDESIHLKQKKRHGVKRHKDDCLCAICKMMRRRQEREESMRGEVNSHLVQGGQSPIESPYQYTSSNMENSSGPDGDSDLEEAKLNITERQYTPKQERVNDIDSNMEKKARSVEILGSSQLGEGSGEKSGEFSVHRNDIMLINSPMKQTNTFYGDRTARVEQNKRKVLINKIERAKILENLQRFENPQLLKLCDTLFTNDVKSVWSGPHSLVNNHRDRSRSSSIHEAISSFMN